MTSTPRRRASRAAATAVAVAMTGLLVAGCGAPAPTAGPAEVTVVKDPGAGVATGPVAKLDAFDVTSTPGAGSLEWGNVTGHVWLPQAVEVVPGINGTTFEAGSVYLKVPAPFPRTARRVASEQDRAAFTEYLEVDVPADDPSPRTDDTDGSEDAAPAGKVIQGVRDSVKYTLTVSPDEGDPDYTVVMVKWEPASADVVPDTGASPDADQTTD